MPTLNAAFPFTAIVGQDELKLALVLSAVQPALGGVLAMGRRGTGKSTAVRSLAALLPPIPVVAGCPWNCDPADPGCPDCIARRARGEALPVEYRPTPVADLPLGADVDRVVGGLDVEAALTEGRPRVLPGLLARAHRGFLYVDEVNLLDDALADVLLDVAASGVNVIEREGVSLRHLARFVLVGSGNPEEGELRPQLLDRFGLAVQVETLRDVARRVEVIRRVQAYHADPEGFRAEWSGREAQLREAIVAARRRLARVAAPADVLERIAAIAAELELEGHRGELAVARAAAARAALAGREEVSLDDVRAVAPLCLAHRVRQARRSPEDAVALVREVVESALPPAAGTPEGRPEALLAGEAT